MKTVADLMRGKAKRGPKPKAKAKVKPGKTARQQAKGAKPGKAGPGRPRGSLTAVKLEELDSAVKRQRAKSECFSEGSECDFQVPAAVVKHLKARARAAQRVAEGGSKRGRGRPPKTDVRSPLKAKVVSKATLLKKKGAVKARVTKDQIAFQKNFRRKSWAKRLVWRGKKVRTSGGLTAKDLMTSKTGRIVSKRRNQVGHRMYKTNHLDLWIASLMRTRGEMGSKGFVKVKKAGTRAERALWEDTCKGWMDMVALRVVKMMQTSPQLMGKVNDRLLTPAGKSRSATASSSSSAQVKDE